MDTRLVMKMVVAILSLYAGSANITANGEISVFNRFPHLITEVNHVATFRLAPPPQLYYLKTKLNG